jgi:hypothetical protein
MGPREAMMNKIVARYANGTMVKGVTADFFPGRETFHVTVSTTGRDAETVVVRMQDLKAVFFVRDYAGNPTHVRQKDFDATHHDMGRRIKVTFKDGEVYIGTTQGYQPGRQGFFVVPIDTKGNDERCYVLTAATREVTLL